MRGYLQHEYDGTATQKIVSYLAGYASEKDAERYDFSIEKVNVKLLEYSFERYLQRMVFATYKIW